MNAHLRIIIPLLITLICFNVRSEEQVGDSDWRARMRSMLSEVLILFPLAFDDAKFKDPKNAQTIEKSMQTLVEKSSGLKQHTSRFSPEKGLKIDPSFPFIAEAFESEVTSAKASFVQGGRSLSESRRYLRSAISKCMLCHTQSANGPELKLTQFKKDLSELSPIDRFTALAATRQFDDAISDYEKFLKSAQSKKSDEFLIDFTSKEAIAILVRVKKDPKHTLALINAISESGSGSPMFRNDLKDWRKAAIAWQSEKPLTLNSDQTLFNEASRLMDIGKKKQKSIEMYESSEIVLLRASSYLHDLLSNYPKSPLRAQSYMLLASTYDLLPGFAMWDLADEYLGACIQENPHSEIGEKCFKEYSDSIIVGYSGSSGTHIPAAVSQHLAHMNEMAKRTGSQK